MATKLTTATANQLADQLDAYTNAGGGAGKIIIYNGTEPATADTALSGNTVLATFTLSATAFGNAASGVITLAGVPLTVAASASGTASFFRLLRFDNAVVLQGSVNTSGAQLNLNTTTITSGVNVTITSGTVTMPTT